MKKTLESKKKQVIRALLKKLSHKNKDDMESSLNAHAVLVELIETEKTFALFMEEEAALVKEMMELALDPLNHFNQAHLLNLLLVVTKQIRPPRTLELFAPRDEEDEGEPIHFGGVTIPGHLVGFNPET